MKINTYPDKTTYIDIENSKKINKTFKINSYRELWQLNQYVDAKNSIGIFPIITIPNLLDAQADRRMKKGESNGLKLVCKLLNRMKATFKIFHPHNPEVVEALINNVEIIDNKSFIIYVLEDLYPGPPGFIDISNAWKNLILMSSDAGGFKPLMKLCDKLGWKGETYSASKYRSYENNKTKLVQLIDKEDFKGKDILIIDDISIYGGTFKGLSGLLKKRNCGKLYLAVSHITVQNQKDNDTVFKYFDKIFTTNSKFDNYFIENKFGEPTKPENLEIIKIFEYDK